MSHHFLLTCEPDLTHDAVVVLRCEPCQVELARGPVLPLDLSSERALAHLNYARTMDDQMEGP